MHNNYNLPLKRINNKYNHYFLKSFFSNKHFIATQHDKQERERQGGQR